MPFMMYGNNLVYSISYNIVNPPSVSHWAWETKYASVTEAIIGSDKVLLPNRQQVLSEAMLAYCKLHM